MTQSTRRMCPSWPVNKPSSADPHLQGALHLQAKEQEQLLLRVLALRLLARASPLEGPLV